MYSALAKGVMLDAIQVMTVATFDQMLGVLIMTEECNALHRSGQGGDYI